MEWFGFIVKVHGDLDKIYLSSLEGTNEWNTKKMKIKLYCKVPNDILITILFRLLKKNSNNYFYDTVLPNQSLSLFFFFLNGREKAAKEYFLFFYRPCAPSGWNGLWRLFHLRVGLVLDRPYQHQPQTGGDASMNCGFCECGMLLVHTEYLCLPWWLWSNVSWLKCTCDWLGDQNQPSCGNELDSSLSRVVGMGEEVWVLNFPKASSRSCVVEVSYTRLWRWVLLELL